MTLATASRSASLDAAPSLYAALEERILQRDQVGASAVYYDLLRAGRPLAELVAEAVRIHAPYTHVPYHERIDDGYVNFVNNDHCLLSARATINLAKLVPAAAAGLPMAQTIWYIPTGLDIWNQKIGRAPGHYTRGFQMPAGAPPSPVVYWPDQEPLTIDGDLKSRLGQWMTLVHRGNVIEAYRVFLGLMQNPAERRAALAELVFAGLIDVQDRAFQNRSYTTGHKSFRARSTVELGDFVGWDKAHDILYAGALDIAVGPRWYSTYEMACNAITVYIDGQALHAVPYGGTSERERALLANTAPLDPAEADGLIDSLLNAHEPDWIERLSALLRAGKGPRQVLDVLQIAAAQVLVRTQDDVNFSIPQHCAEYCSTLGWFYDTFQHQQRVKLLYVAAAFINRNAWHQRNTGDLRPVDVRAPAGADKMTAAQILGGLDTAILALDGPQSVAWTRAYLDSGADRAPLTERLALLGARMGNDPHNQELAQCLIDDWRRNRGEGRDWLLLACAQHTARHRKYGDFLDCARRFGAAMNVAGLA
ncbi:MAG TPA: hypothetical protein VJ890_06035 [Vineibacter sp.]|nr:hypothetical protein [Vineibacter sp.]